MSLNLSLVLAGDNSGAKAAIGDTRTEVRGLGDDARNAATVLDQEAASTSRATEAAIRVTNAINGQTAAENNLRAALERRLGISANTNGVGDPFAQNAQRAADVEAYGRSLDAVRARFVPLVAAEQQHLQALQQINNAARLGAISEDERAAAIANATRAYERQIALIRNGPSTRSGNGVQSFAGFNAGQQLQDIVMMSLLGQNPGALALQQGPQLASAIEMGGGLGALKSGLMTLLSPTMAITVALTAATAAAIQFGSSIVSRGKSIDDVLKGHKSLIDEITKSFPQAAAAAKQYEDQAKLLPQSVVGADATQQMKDETDAYQKAMRDFRVQFNLLIQGDTGQGDFAKVGKTGVAAFAEISKGIKTGQIDAIELQRRLGELRVDPSLSKDTREFYGQLQEAINRAAELERHMQGSAAAGHALAGAFNGPGGLPLLLDPNTGEHARNQALSDRDAELARMRRSGAADIASIYARSPSELAAAARARAAADATSGEDPQVRALRVQQAGDQALLQAEHQLQQAQEQRARSYAETLASQQLDLSLIGKTAGEVAGAQFAFQQYQQVREEAARNGITSETEFQKVFGGEIAMIDQAAKKMQEYADRAARAHLAYDQAFDISQLGRSPVDQQVASTEKQYGLPIDLNSADAAAIRYALNVKSIASAWQNVASVGMDAIDQLSASAAGGFKNIDDVVNSILGDIEKQFMQLAFANPLKNAIYGAGLPTLDSMGGAGAFFSALTGGKFNPGSIPGLGQSVGAMTVQAGVVNLNGAGLGGDLAGSISRLFAPANDNSMAAFAASIRSLESSGNYSALGPLLSTGDRAYGAYGIMGSNIGPWSMSALGRSLTPDQFLSDPSAQDAIFQKIFGGYLSRFGNANDAASAWFTGRPLSAGAGASDIFGTTGQSYVDQFNTNLRQMAGATAGATDNLSNFGSGLGQLGQSLQQAATAGGGGGGIFGALSHLFGFGGSSFGNLFPAAPTGVPVNSLTPADYGFADGTLGAPPGWAWVGERGPELMRFRGGEQVMPSPLSFAVTRGYANGTPGIGTLLGTARPAVVINDMRGSDAPAIEQRQSLDADGNPQIELFIRQAVQDEVTRPSAKTNRSLRGTFDLKHALVTR